MLVSCYVENNCLENQFNTIAKFVSIVLPFSVRSVVIGFPTSGFVVCTWRHGLVELLDPGSMDTADGISLLTCVQAEVNVFSIQMPPTWISHFRFLPVWWYNIATTPIAQLDPENIGTALGIALLSCIQAEIYVFQVYMPPSWISHFRFLPVWSHNIATTSIG